MSRTAIVTGASRGIGVALVRALLDADFRVHAVARDGARLESTYRAEIDAGHVLPAALDVTDPPAVDAFFAERFSGDGAPIDLLFNNAGLNKSFAPVWDSDPETWWRDVTVNLYGLFLMTRSALRVMRQHNRGIVVNMDGGRPIAASAYGASKAAVVQFTDLLHKELRRDGTAIAVYAANPGLVETDMTRAQLAIPLAREWLGIDKALVPGKTREPEEIARKLVLLLPRMSSATSGRYFSPGTPDGEFTDLPL